MSEDSYIQSVLKAAAMLRLVGEATDGMKLAEIAKEMNLKLPAIHHLSKTLISCGFLNKDKDNVLTLGCELIRLASRAAGDIFIDSASIELTRLFGLYPQGVVVLAEVNPPQIDMLLRISYERPNVIQKENGQVFNIYVNAVALTALALVDEESRELLMEKQPYSEYGALLWQERKRLDEFLKQVQHDEITVCPFDQQTSFRVAAPVWGKGKSLKGAIGLSIPASKIMKINKGEIFMELQKSAAQVSEKISGS